MFESATLKLTGWFLLVIMVISVTFSALIYFTSTTEFYGRFETLWQDTPLKSEVMDDEEWTKYRHDQAEEAAHNILMNLIYINALLLSTGFLVSMLMARKTLEPLRRAHEKQERFVSSASHELRTPLAAMKTEIEVGLRDPSLSTADLRTIMRSNLEEVNKLTELSQDLLSLSKMDYQKIPRKEVDLHSVIATALKRYEPSSSRFVITKHDSPLLAYGNQIALEVLTAVLIDNALKYSPKDSKITMRAYKKRGMIHFTITNTGKGIKEDDLAHVFERFYRADGARTQTDSPSFGLGLSLAKRVIELHDGELSVTGGDNSLTTFHYSVPVYISQKA